MKKFLLFLILCCSLNFSSAQSVVPEVITTSGSSFNNGTSQLDWTLGEPATATLDNGNNTITQGFHQPNLLITSVNEPETAYAVNVFPNPATEQVQLQFKNLKEDLTVELLSADGRLLETKEGTGDLQFSMIAYPAGTYLLSVKSKQSKTRTYKIIKSH